LVTGAAGRGQGPGYLFAEALATKWRPIGRVASYLHKSGNGAWYNNHREDVMPVNKLFGGGIALLGKALDLRAQRQGLIQSNIANMETPGYTGQDFPFAKVMAKVQSGSGELVRTNPGHLAVEPGQTDGSLAATGDKRPVDLDEEMVKLSENQLMYQVTAKLVAKRFEAMQYAIDEGGK